MEGEQGNPPPEKPRDTATIMTTTAPDPPPDPRPLYNPPPNPEKAKEGEGEMSKEDAELKERLELAVERLKDPQLEVRRLALELLRKEIRESTRCGARALSPWASRRRPRRCASPPASCRAQPPHPPTPHPLHPPPSSCTFRLPPAP